MSIYNVETMNDKDIRLRATVGKWGNSAAVRIPATLLAQAKLTEKQAIDLVLSDGKITLEPVSKEEFRLEDLLAQITPSNLHGEVETGEPVGREAL